MNKSESIAKLAGALIAFHGEVGKVQKDGINPHFKNKYASLSNILDTVTPVLTKHGLAVVQLPCGTSHLETILLHTSGEFISEVFEMTPIRPDPQAVGSAITYARRYALGAILSLNIDEDDDGNRAARQDKSKSATANGVGDPRLSPPARKDDKGEDYHRIYDEATIQVERADTLEALTKIFSDYPTLSNDSDFIAACTLRKSQLVRSAKTGG